MELRKTIFILTFVFLIPAQIFAQADKHWIKHQISVLAGTSMNGRGYTDKGILKAGVYILKEFRSFGLQPVNGDSTYLQYYFFPVNTFPGQMLVATKKLRFLPGVDYLVDAASTGFDGDGMKVSTLDLAEITELDKWDALKEKLRPDNKIYLLKNADTLAKLLNTNMRKLPGALPKGCYIIPVHGKLTWDVATDTIPATVIYMEDTILPKKLKKLDIHILNKYLPSGVNKNENIIGCVPGTSKDSFIVFTAHYDHLGEMGKGTIFPGASDNASGMAMLLLLAHYYAERPQHYTMVFIAFSGEEAGLIGSDFFVNHPMIPLSNIRFLTNLDIMGDASDGITVVNATEYPRQFNILQQINTEKGYLPQLKSRGKAAISDHYHFTQAGVPSFFFYSNGGKGYYHDVFDQSAAVTLTNIDAVAKLIVEFTAQINKDVDVVKN